MTEFLVEKSRNWRGKENAISSTTHIFIPITAKQPKNALSHHTGNCPQASNNSSGQATTATTQNDNNNLPHNPPSSSIITPYSRKEEECIPPIIHLSPTQCYVQPSPTRMSSGPASAACTLPTTPVHAPAQRRLSEDGSCEAQEAQFRGEKDGESSVE